jgi:hypothetical protein
MAPRRTTFQAPRVTARMLEPDPEQVEEPAAQGGDVTSCPSGAGQAHGT